jgi:hypothetical protein
MLEDMMALADEYQVDFLIDKCKGYLKKQLSKDIKELRLRTSIMSPSNDGVDSPLEMEQTMMYLYLCHRYNHSLSLWDCCFTKALLFDYNEVKKNQHFQNLPKDLQTKLGMMRLQAISTYFEKMKCHLGEENRCADFDSSSYIVGRPKYCDPKNQSAICKKCVNHKVQAEAQKLMSDEKQEKGLQSKPLKRSNTEQQGGSQTTTTKKPASILTGCDSP